MQAESLAYDQAGCRMIQQNLETSASSSFITALVNAL